MPLERTLCKRPQKNKVWKESENKICKNFRKDKHLDLKPSE